jgi:hypothetical protein
MPRNLHTHHEPYNLCTIIPTVWKYVPTVLHITLFDYTQQHSLTFMSTKYLIAVNGSLHPSDIQTLHARYNLSIKLHTVTKCDTTYIP